MRHTHPVIFFPLFLLLAISSGLVHVVQGRSTITLGYHPDASGGVYQGGKKVKVFYGRGRGGHRGLGRRQEGEVQGVEGVGGTNSTTALKLVVSTTTTASSLDLILPTPTGSISTSMSLTAPSFEQPIETPLAEPSSSTSTTSTSVSSFSSSSSSDPSASGGLTPYVYTGPTWSAVYTISSSSTTTLSSSPIQPTQSSAESVDSESPSPSDPTPTATTTQDQPTSPIVVPMETTIVPVDQSGSTGVEVSTLFFTPTPSVTTTSTSATELSPPGKPIPTPSTIRNPASPSQTTTSTTTDNFPTRTTLIRTHTIVINPTEGIKKLIPFVVSAQPGDRLGFILYGDESSSSSPTGTTAGSKLGMTRVGEGCKPLDGVKMEGEDVDGVWEVEVGPDDKGQMVFGSTGNGDCLGGMVLLVNIQNGIDDEGKEKLKFGEVEVNGTTIRQAVTTWGAQTQENLETLRTFQSSPQMTPQAWTWGDDLHLDGLERVGVDLGGIVQNVLYTRLTLALNPSLLEEYTNTTSGLLNPTSPLNSTTASNSISIVTELTAHPTFLPSSAGTTEVYGGNAVGTVSAGYERAGSNGAGRGARVSELLIGVGVALVGVVRFII